MDAAENAVIVKAGLVSHHPVTDLSLLWVMDEMPLNSHDVLTSANRVRSARQGTNPSGSVVMHSTHAATLSSPDPSAQVDIKLDLHIFYSKSTSVFGFEMSHQRPLVLKYQRRELRQGGRLNGTSPG